MSDEAKAALITLCIFLGVGTLVLGGFFIPHFMDVIGWISLAAVVVVIIWWFYYVVLQFVKGTHDS